MKFNNVLLYSALACSSCSLFAAGLPIDVTFVVRDTASLIDADQLASREPLPLPEPEPEPTKIKRLNPQPLPPGASSERDIGDEADELALREPLPLPKPGPGKRRYLKQRLNPQPEPPGASVGEREVDEEIGELVARG